MKYLYNINNGTRNKNNSCAFDLKKNRPILWINQGHLYSFFG